MIPLNNKALKVRILVFFLVFKLLAVKTLQTEKTIETVKKVGYILKTSQISRVNDSACTVRVRNFQGTLHLCEQSIINSFSVYMTVPLEKYLPRILSHNVIHTLFYFTNI